MRPTREFEEFTWCVLRAAADYANVPALALMGNLKSKTLARGRAIAMRVMRDLTGTSYPMLGAMFGRHHTTVLNSRNADPVGVAIVKASVAGLPVPPPFLPAPVTPIISRRTDRCPKCGSPRIFLDKERADDTPQKRKPWFCADCDVTWDTWRIA